MCAQGAINPIVSERFPLERAGDAIARLATREAKGKVIVTID
jgi:NADPH2:quinone reductase